MGSPPVSDERLSLSKPHRVVRWLSAGLLVTCVGMIVLGNTAWKNDLKGVEYTVFWSWCFLLAGIAIVAAMADLFLLGRAYRRQRRELFRREFMGKEFQDEIQRKLPAGKRARR